jgi:hypothetical protein
MIEGARWLPKDGVFVAGKPLTDIWAPSGLRWRDVLSAHIAGPLRNPRLAFSRTDRRDYDLDNLVYPVVAVAGCAPCESVSASVVRATPEGVLIAECPPPPPPTGGSSLSLYIASPSSSSIAGRPTVPELADAEEFGEDEPLGMALQFDRADVAVGELSFDGPIKSLVDDLTPLFGQRMISGRMYAKGYRVRELRITRGHAPEKSGVTVTLWYL